MKFGLKWVHMARYELILRLDGALWLRILLKPLLVLKSAMEWPKIRKKNKKSSRIGQAQAVLRKHRKITFQIMETFSVTNIQK